ncbi:hypothetical protein B0H12DRAFT_1136588 [Mycena haematopus]|nr:hypothetical protein B0H12DRAFT_1136588 [Mycena haematopus]
MFLIDSQYVSLSSASESRFGQYLSSPCLCDALVCYEQRRPGFHVEPFRIDLAHEIPRMKALVQYTRLPCTTLYPAAGINFGIQ